MNALGAIALVLVGIGLFRYWRGRTSAWDRRSAAGSRRLPGPGVGTGAPMWPVPA